MRLVIALTVAFVAFGCGGGGNNNGDGGPSLCVEPSVEYVPAQSGGWESVCMQPAALEVVRTQCGEVTERCDTTGSTAPEPPAAPGAAACAARLPGTAVTLCPQPGCSTPPARLRLLS